MGSEAERCNIRPLSLRQACAEVKAPMIGAYLHIPFCAYKCHYCDFATSTRTEEFGKRYCQILEREIKDRLSEAADKPHISTVFYGGGTPGLLDIEYLNQIHGTLLKNIVLLTDYEISLETNPETVTREKAKIWREIGINRLSIGIQSFNDSELTALGRGHSSTDAIKAIEIASDVGFDNINCDLMYGLPGQNLTSWQNSINSFIKLANKYPQIKHVSAYGLELSPAAPLIKMIPLGSNAYPSEEVFEEQLKYLVTALEQAGFMQYEISNFAKSGYECRHNLNYWKQGEYHAFGVSAHRYIKPYRSSNWRSLGRYLDDCLTNETCELIDQDLARTEAVMLGLRMNDGLNLKLFKQSYGEDLLDTHKEIIEKLIAHNLLAHTADRLKLTILGQPVANTIIGEFLQ